MKTTFYRYGVDIASVKSMWNFLKNHYTYSTMNSWNGQKSIAHNVKLYNLKLDGDWTVVLRYLYDETDAGGLQFLISDLIRQFENQHPCYKIGFNGRSGGYIVLYNDDNYLSVLPDCVDSYYSYDEFKQDIKDHGYRVSDFDSELRNIVEVVRDFDRLCDELREVVNDYSKSDYDKNKLEEVISRFEDLYSDDLEDLGLVGPELVEDKVRLNSLAKYTAFRHCFIELFGEDRRRVHGNEGYVWLKEE